MKLSRPALATVGLGDQNMVIDVSIQIETSRQPNPLNSNVLVFALPPKGFQAGRCSRCRRRCRCPFDGGDGTCRWRTFDVGTLNAYLQTAAPRVRCGEHGLVVAHVWWSRWPEMPRRHVSTGCQVVKCAWFMCAATRKALAATVKLGFIPVLEGKNEVSTT